MKKHFLSALLCLLCAVTAVGLLSAVTVMAEEPVTGGFIITGGTEGTDYEWRGDQLVILTDTPVTVRNHYAAETVTQTILIGRNVSANVTLNGVNIGAANSTPAVQIDGTSGNVTLILKGVNILTGGDDRAAIEKNGLNGKLTLIGSGSLTAYGGTNAPGIGVRSGNSYDHYSTHVEFVGGTITSIGGSGAYADIGTDGSTHADIRISPTASVKGSCSNEPIGLSQERIGQLIVQNPNGKTVTVDGNKLLYTEHLDEDQLYLWLPVGEHQVMLDSDSQPVNVINPYGLIVTGGVEGIDYVYPGEELQILTSTPMIISNSNHDAPTVDMIYVAKDVDADLTLAGVNIDSRGGLRIADDSLGNVQIRLADGTENTLRASAGAGLQKNGANGALTISGKGSLDAYGGYYSAGIGGGVTFYDEGTFRGTGNITITDGIITAHGGVKGAGIGSGLWGSVESLTFTGGTVEAYGNDDSTGIGSGDEGSVSKILISGGNISASSIGYKGAGIGSGDSSSVEEITITGGTVNASAESGAAIGSGYRGSAELIRISGGNITANTTSSGAAIGSGLYGYADSIQISGGTVAAFQKYMFGTAVGAGDEGHIREIAITGGNITTEAANYSSPESNISIGTKSDDPISITIRDCVLTTIGKIGSSGSGKQSVVIGKNTTVKSAGISSVPVNESNEAVYLLKVENPTKETITIGGEVFPYRTHNEEKALYPYRPGRDTAVKIGTEKQTVLFDAKTSSFAGAHVPESERRGVTEPTCTRDGYTGDLYCAGCNMMLEKGESIPCTGHDSTITVIREATLTKPGEVQMHCSVCGADYKAAQRCIGDFIVSGIEKDDDVSFSGGVLTILKNRTLMIQNIYPNEPTTAQIAVADGVQARIILAGIHIDSRSTGAAAISLADGSSGDVRIELADGSHNLLFSGSGCAGLQKNGGTGTLTITGNGTLMAVGGSGAAGIGSGKGHLLRNLTIESGYISALGGIYGAGIGSGQNFSAENIRITGGKITAEAGTRACGIGHGNHIFNFTDTENLVIGSMASVKATGSAGALGTKPVNEAGEQVYLCRYGIPANGFLLINRTTRFPYTSHDGEAQVYVYLSFSQTAEPRSEGSSQLLTGSPCAAGVLITPATLTDENTRVNLTCLNVDGLDELAEKYADEGKTVIVTLTTDSGNTADSEKLKTAARRENVESFTLALTKQVDGNAPVKPTGDTPLTLIIPFDFENTDSDSVCVLRTGSGQKLKKNPVSGQEGYFVNVTAGTITVTLCQVSDLAIAYDSIDSSEPEETDDTPLIQELCRLTFITGDGSPISDISGQSGNVILLERFVPTREGFLFGGWYGDAALTQPLTSIRLIGDHTIWAKWIELTEPAQAAFPFTDVAKSDSFYEDVQYVYDNGLMIGVSDSRFAPQTELSRAMIVTILYRLEGEPAFMNDNIFTDVERDSWYEKAVVWANGKGIVLGYGDGRFGPEDPVTREQMAAIFYRYAQYKDYDISIDENTNFLSFCDVFKISEYAQAPMFWALDNSLIDGENGWLYPGDPADRSVVAAILHRFCEMPGK